MVPRLSLVPTVKKDSRQILILKNDDNQVVEQLRVKENQIGLDGLGSPASPDVLRTRPGMHRLDIFNIFSIRKIYVRDYDRVGR